MKSPYVEDFKEMLRSFRSYEENIQSINDELEFIESILYSPSGANTVSFNFGGGDFNSTERKVNDLIAKKGKLSEQLIYLEYQYLTIKKALTFLNDEEMKLITLRYFKKYKIAKIEQETFKSKSVIYEELDRAVGKMIQGLYGKVR